MAESATPDWDQIQWWAAATGQTPEQLASALIREQEAKNQQAQFAQWPATTIAQPTIDYANSRMGANDPIIAGMTAQTAAAFQQQQAIAAQNQRTAWNSQQDANELAGTLRGLGAESISSRDQGNAADQAQLGRYTQALNNATQWDLANYGNLAQANANTPILQARGWSGDIGSQAAGAYADPASIAAQNQALGFLQNGMNGGLDYQSQAAYAYADPAAVNAQYDSLAQLQGAAGGSLNASSQAALAHASQAAIQRQYEQMANLDRIAQGSLNVTSQGQYVQPDVEMLNQQRAAAEALQGLASGRGDVNFWGIEGIHNLQNASQGGLDVDMSNLEGARDLREVGRGSKDINAATLAGMSELQAAGRGAKDINVWDIAGMRDLEQVSQGARDVRPGQLDPAAYAAQQDALSKYKAGTDPAITAQERLMYLQAQQKQEQDEASLQAARLDDMNRRGVGGGAAEIAAGYGASRQISQNRQLGDFQALANAQARAERMLGGYATQANVLGAQANDLAAGNATRQLQALGQMGAIGTDVAGRNQSTQLGALGQYAGITADVAARNQALQAAAVGQYAGLESTNEQANNARTLQALGLFTGLGAEIETGNKNRQLQAQGMAYDAYGNLRNQSFAEGAYRADSLDRANQFNAGLQAQGSQWAYDAASDIRKTEFGEEFARGSAYDTVQAQNLTRQLQAMGLSNDAATNIRDSSFDERFRTGMAADTASANNQQARLQSGYYAGNIATQMRDSSFNEDFSRKTAADMTAQFNTSQRMINQRFQDEYAAQQQTNAWNRQTDVSNLGNTVGRNYAADQGSLAQAGFLVNNNTDNRNQQSINTRAGLGTQTFNAQEEARRTQLGANQNESNTLSNQLNNIYGLGGTMMQNEGYKTQLGLGIGDRQMAAIMGDMGVQAARPAAYTPPAQQGDWFTTNIGQPIADFSNSPGPNNKRSKG